MRIPAPIAATLVLALGATLGALLRYYGTLWATAHFGAGFPYGTLLINVSGSFILGCFLTLASGPLAQRPLLHLFVATGFCGSFTTFSTFSYETVALLARGDFIAGAANALGSLALGILGVVLGAALIRALFPA